MCFSLTVALTVHSETAIAGATVRSADDAIEQVEKKGVSVERLIAMDKPTDECRSYIAMSNISHWRILEYNYGDQGAVRNDVAIRAGGRWLAFIDGDDLYSRNYLSKAMFKSDGFREDSGTIMHPEINWFFGEQTSVVVNVGQGDELFTPHFLAIANCFDALCVGPVRAWREVPYPPRDLVKGFAFEDWQWALETMWGGWRHELLRDTIVFKRRRSGSQSSYSRGAHALIREVAPTQIDRMKMLP